MDHPSHPSSCKNCFLFLFTFSVCFHFVEVKKTLWTGKEKKFHGPCEARTHDLGVAVGSETQVYQHRALPTELTDHQLIVTAKIKVLN